MSKILLVGETGSGKSDLIRLFAGGKYRPRRLMAVEYHGPFITTPGEFLENRRFYPALITTAAECAVVLLLQDSTRASCLFPPGFAAMLNRTVHGVATGAKAECANPERAGRFLRNAGARSVFTVDARTGLGLAELRAALPVEPM